MANHGINQGLRPGRSLSVNVTRYESQKNDLLNAPRVQSEPVIADISSVRYGAAYNDVTGANAPSGINDGIQGPGGRYYAEVMGMTALAGTPGIAVVLRSGSKGVQALIGLSSSTVTAGQVRWWIQDVSSRLWYATPVVDVLQVGVQNVATPEQLLTVGAK